MTSIMKFLKDNKITAYSVTKKLGKKNGWFGRNMKQLKGEAQINYADCLNIIKAIEELSGKKLEAKDLFDISVVRFK